MSPTLEAIERVQPARAKYLKSLIDRVVEMQHDGGVKAQVAVAAVRGISNGRDAEWSVLTETFGEPTFKDWQGAQRAYGPNPRFPGLDEPHETWDGGDFPYGLEEGD